MALPESPRQPMDQPESMRPKTKSEGSTSRGGPPGKSPSVPRSPAPIPSVPDYDLLRRIGGGAYGEVWLARSKATGALRAAKIVWRHTFEDERPFEREFEGIQKFERISRNHPSQLALFHIGRNEAGGYFYYLMELADSATPEVSPIDYSAHTLRADLEKGRLPAAKVLEIGLVLNEALSHLHANGLVHRDVKPSNVIFVNGRPKLADIGLVTDTSDQCSIVGTEGYLPPEGPGTPQADIFALGRVLYEAVTGLDRREFPKLPDGLRTWPDAAQVFELNEIILKACAPDLKQRYQNAESMRDDLELLRIGKSVKKKRTKQRYWTIGQRGAIGLATLAAIVVIAGIWLQQVKSANLYPDGPPSTNMDANTLCTKGLLIIRGDNYSEFAEAYTNFHEAIQLDSNFAQPYVGLLELRLREGTPSLPPSTPAEMSRITDQLGRLAPNVAATAVAKSIISYNHREYPTARRFALQAIKINTRYELGHTWYGFMLTQWGWPLEGRKELEKARELAPSKVTIYRCLGHTYYMQRDFTNAILWYRKALELEPHHSPAYEFMGQAYEALDDYTNGLECLEMSELIQGADKAQIKLAYDGVRETLAKHGIKGYWEDQWLGTMKYPERDFLYKAIIRSQLGDTNGAMDWLEKYYHNSASSDINSDGLLLDYYWDGLHESPRFRKLLDQMGYTKVVPSGLK